MSHVVPKIGSDEVVLSSERFAVLRDARGGEHLYLGLFSALATVDFDDRRRLEQYLEEQKARFASQFRIWLGLALLITATAVVFQALGKYWAYFITWTFGSLLVQFFIHRSQRFQWVENLWRGSPASPRVLKPSEVRALKRVMRPRDSVFTRIRREETIRAYAGLAL